MRQFKVIVRGILGEFAQKINNERKRTANFSARYSFSIWMRHLIKLSELGYTKLPDSIAEIGPGNSLGLGLAALLSGVKKYYAFDIIKYNEIEKNIELIPELVNFYQNCEKIPDNTEFKSMKPLLKSYEFPSKLITKDILKDSINIKNINNIKENLEGNITKDDNRIHYISPWNEFENIKEDSIDLVVSQAVMEHVIDLEKTYLSINKWLKNGGLMSHQIDFKAHETSKLWYGHRLYSDFTWNLIMRGSVYPINREPYLVHKNIIEDSGFEILYELPHYQKINHDIKKFNKKFHKYDINDLTISSIYIVAKKIKSINNKIG